MIFRFSLFVILALAVSCASQPNKIDAVKTIATPFDSSKEARHVAPALPVLVSYLKHNRIDVTTEELKRDLMLQGSRAPQEPLIVALLASKGLNPQVENESTLNALLKKLKLNQPVLVEIRKSRHLPKQLVIVNGYNLQRQQLRLQTALKKEVWLPFKEFEARWIGRWALSQASSNEVPRTALE